MDNDKQLLNNNDKKIQNKVDNPHKSLKIATIVMFVLCTIAFVANTSIFIMMATSDNLGKALIFIFFYLVPIVSLIFNAISLIVSSCGWKKLKSSKIITIINICLLIIQIIYLILYFILVN